MHCPNCNSTDVARKEMIHAAGTRSGSYEGSDRYGERYSGSIETQSTLAFWARPPRAAGELGCTLHMVLFGLLLCGGGPALDGLGLGPRRAPWAGIAILLALAAVTASALRMAVRNSRINAARRAAWAREWMCRRCGCTFVP